MEIKKRNSGIGDDDVAKMIEKLKTGHPIHGDDGRTIGIKSEDGDRIMISDWEHKVIGSFKNVRFQTPPKDDKFLKFIEPRISLFRNGKIATILPYWGSGIKIEGELVTRTYRVADHPELTETGVPFGAEVVGEVRVCESRNSYTRKVRVIIDHYLYLAPTTATHEVKRIEDKGKNTVFSHPIPRTKEAIVINKIGK